MIKIEFLFNLLKKQNKNKKQLIRYGQFATAPHFSPDTQGTRYTLSTCVRRGIDAVPVSSLKPSHTSHVVSLQQLRQSNMLAQPPGHLDTKGKS